MAQVTDISARTASYRLSARRMAGWVREHVDLLIGVRGLGALGDDGALILRTLPRLPELNTTRLAWDLVRAMVEGDGFDAEALLLAELPLELVELVDASFDLLERHAA